MPRSPRSPQLDTLRELVRCYQAFEAYSALQIRFTGLTPAQFDIIATLGNTEGMNFKELGAKTLITKGTLTGVVDRLEARKLVRREASATDGRSQIVVLTEAGEAMFEHAFPTQLAHIDAAFAQLTVADLGATTVALARLRGAFEQAREQAASKLAALAPTRQTAG